MTELAQPDRLAKIEALRAAGADPYPARGVEARPIDGLLAGAGTAEKPGPLVGEHVTVAGRLLQARDFGKLMFAPLVDRTGKIQIGFQRDELGAWWPQRKLLDAGDLLGVTGKLGHTQKGETTVWATEVKLLAKAVAPPPEKWHGLVDKELRYRRRYVDLWASDGVLQVFVKRSKVLSVIRRLLESEGYLEVETPTLHPIAGGAIARPFITHHNALGMDLYLRIAPELYLKRLIVGGLERVFEVARNFRNEGLSARHNPEFTMLELYEAQADYRRMMELTERIIETSALAVNGTTEVTFRGRKYDLKPPFPRRAYADLFREKNGCAFDDEPAVRKRAAELGLAAGADFWKSMNDVFEATVEDSLTGPMFVVDYPVPICPLAKKKPEDPKLAERFEIFIAGMELGNAFTELNDPADQARRFEEQVASKDPEAPGEVDWDYVQALEYGMPPAGGLGIGIDRLVMVLTGQESIRDVLLFPAMRPTSGADAPPES
ncbi:MAG TPA: lysine--tRNA ligase [Planctomycetota bacterium]|jgi:lysyl-tRNA synthetase class 2|nr:lysine--tRNA ligase [Planctomycetota bacterium]